MIKIEPVSPVLGAIISGVKLREPLTDSQFATIRKALTDHLVVFFHDQQLDIQQFHNFASRFGPLDPIIGPPRLRDDLPEVALIAGDGGKEKRGLSAGVWHSDVAHFERPYDYGLLYSVKLPSLGGDTLFASNYAVYDMLPPKLQELMDELQVHNANPNQFANPRDPGDSRYLQTSIHPVVAVHPETGRKYLNVSELYARRIVDVPSWQSRNLLNLLYDVVKQPECQFRFRWKIGAMAIWDNRSTQHFGVSDYFGYGDRKLYRIGVEGSKPINVKDAQASSLLRNT